MIHQSPQFDSPCSSCSHSTAFHYLPSLLGAFCISYRIRETGCGYLATTSSNSLSICHPSATSSGTKGCLPPPKRLSSETAQGTFSINLQPTRYPSIMLQHHRWAAYDGPGKEQSGCGVYCNTTSDNWRNIANCIKGKVSVYICGPKVPEEESAAVRRGGSWLVAMMAGIA